MVIFSAFFEFITSFSFEVSMPEIITVFNKDPWLVKSLVGAEGDLIVIQVIHSEFDVEAMKLSRMDD